MVFSVNMYLFVNMRIVYKYIRKYVSNILIPTLCILLLRNKHGVQVSKACMGKIDTAQFVTVTVPRFDPWPLFLYPPIFYFHI